MTYSHFSYNGEVKSIDQAVIPLDSVEYSYGFGVYETIRLSKGTVYFAEDHCQRLLQSARIIGLQHSFNTRTISSYIDNLLILLKVDTANIKIMLIGGQTAASAQLYILCTNPLFPERKLYRQGAHAITYNYERLLPQAKSLNMLGSYLAYRQAKQAGAYDALLVNKTGHITEGTRTNFYTIRGRQIFTPPETDILLGVTRDKILALASDNGFGIKELGIKPEELRQYNSAFITSTSSKIMPLKSVNNYTYPEISAELRDLMRLFDDYLKSQT